MTSRNDSFTDDDDDIMKGLDELGKKSAYDNETKQKMYSDLANSNENDRVDEVNSSYPYSNAANPQSIATGLPVSKSKKSFFSFRPTRKDNKISPDQSNENDERQFRNSTPMGGGMGDSPSFRSSDGGESYESFGEEERKERAIPIYFIVLLIIGLLFIIAGVIGILYFTVIEPPSTPAPTPQPFQPAPPVLPLYPTNRPTPQPNSYLDASKAAIDDLIAPLYSPAKPPLDDSNSPQFKALEWVSFQDPLQLPPGSPDQLLRWTMATLFFAFSGFNWERRDFWLSSTTVCVWFGVKCEEIIDHEFTLDSVSNLVLPRNNLEGSIPLEIGLFTNLNTLALQRNKISGSIPTTIGMLHSICCLELYSNRLKGVLPTQIGDIRTLRQLYLDSNSLTGVLPAQISNLIELRDLTLFDNSFFGTLPGGMSAFTNLERLWVSGNSFTGTIPSFLNDMHRLEYLFLDKNRFTGLIPARLSSNTLVDVRLNNNRLIGCVPVQYFKMPNLRVLYLDNNQLFCELYMQIYSAPSLEFLELSNNQFFGNIPEVLTDESELKVLRLDRNSLASTLPTSLGKLSNIEKLDFSQNRIIQPLPEELCNLENLRKLLINNNTIMQTIPDWFPGIKELTVLQLNNNTFTGTIPESLADIDNIELLTLDTNNVTGKVPEELCEMDVFITADSCGDTPEVVCTCCVCDPSENPIEVAVAYKNTDITEVTKTSTKKSKYKGETEPVSSGKNNNFERYDGGKQTNITFFLEENT